MAGFKTHITTSTAVGIGGASAACVLYHVPWEACFLGGCLCSVAGMLPDLDSDTGVPRRESVAFAAAVIPMMMVGRLHHLQVAPEMIAISGAATYLFIRFGLGKILEKFSDHRGMFHSIPAMLISGELTFLLCFSGDIWLRYFLACSTMLGFAIHLILDEIWAIDWSYGVPRFKKSFGTAIKWWSDSMWANFSTYAKLGGLTYILFNDPNWMADFEDHRPVQEVAERLKRHYDGFMDSGAASRFLPDAGAGTPVDAQADERSDNGGGDPHQSGSHLRNNSGAQSPTVPNRFQPIANSLQHGDASEDSSGEPRPLSNRFTNHSFNGRADDQHRASTQPDNGGSRYVTPAGGYSQDEE